MSLPRLTGAPEAAVVLPPLELVDGLAPEALPGFVLRLSALLAHAAARMALSHPTVQRQGSHSPTEECYLSVEQLAIRMPYAAHTIRNLMASGVFRENEHYFKRRGRIMFWWPAVRTWAEGNCRSVHEQIPLVRSRRRAG